MWKPGRLEDSKTLQHFTISSDETRLSYRDVLNLWQEESESGEQFRDFFTHLLTSCPFVGFRWETPPLVTDNVDREFEFVLLRCDMLERPVDPHAFALHFNDSDSVVTFDNLGRNAVLVAPCPIVESGNENIYGHLAAFLRGAPNSQTNLLWKKVAQAMWARIGSKPVWLSTAGMGVSWLHVRLDDRPKYYGHHPFKSPPGNGGSGRRSILGKL